MFTFDSPSTWYPTCAVFDCDGILIDSETKWNAYQRTLFADYGATITPELEEYLTGSTANTVAEELARLTLPAGTSYREHYQKILDHILSAEHTIAGEGAELIPGAMQVMALLAEAMPVAVASNSSSDLLTHKMHHYGYAPYLTTWIGADDVPAAKPAPDMYLEAVHRLGGTPQKALTFEDSGTGVRAAQAAGTVTLVFTSTPNTAPRGNGYFTSFRDPALLKQLDSWITQAQHKS